MLAWSQDKADDPPTSSKEPHVLTSALRNHILIAHRVIPYSLFQDLTVQLTLINSHALQGFRTLHFACTSPTPPYGTIKCNAARENTLAAKTTVLPVGVRRDVPGLILYRGLSSGVGPDWWVSCKRQRNRHA